MAEIARFAIAVFVIGFGAFVFLAMRQRVAVPSGGGDAANVDPEVVAVERRRRIARTASSASSTVDLKYEKALTYKDGRTTLVGVTLTLPDRNGRTFIVTADEGELLAPPDKPADICGREAQGQREAHDRQRPRGPRIGGDLRRARRASSTVPGPVTFTRGRMKGSGVGATYDRNRDVLWLLARPT